MPPPGPHRPHRTQAMLPPFPPCLKPGMGPGSTNRVQGSGYPTAAQAPSSEHLPQPAGAPLIRFQPPPAHIMALAAFAREHGQLRQVGCVMSGPVPLLWLLPLRMRSEPPPSSSCFVRGWVAHCSVGSKVRRQTQLTRPRLTCPGFPVYTVGGMGKGMGFEVTETRPGPPSHGCDLRQAT